MFTEKLLMRASAYKLLLLLLCTFTLVQTVRSQMACDICDCHTKDTFYVVNCDNRRLGEIPDHLPSQTTNLSLSNNYIKFLDRLNLSSLLDFKADNNKIEYMLSTAFQACTKLRVLDLSENRISHLPDDTFVYQKHLRILSLGGNRLSTLCGSQHLFTALTELTELQLGSNNLSCIKQDAFKTMSSLKTLRLENNRFGQIFNLYGNNSQLMFKDLSSLENINLDRNRIAFLPADLFSSLKHIRNVSIEQNYLTNISPAAFPRNHQLHLYNLAKNSISTVLERDMKQLNVCVFDFTDNPFDCTCDLAWFCSWLKNKTTGVRNKSLYTCRQSAERLVDFDPVKHGCHPGELQYKLAFRILWIGLLVADLVIIVLFIIILKDFQYLQSASLIKKYLPRRTSDGDTKLLPTSEPTPALQKKMYPGSNDISHLSKQNPCFQGN